jgi:ribonuclease P protein component
MTARHGQGFPKAARIRRRREFLSLGRTGEKRRTENFVLLLRPASAEARLGITVSRKVGGAVTRNLLKRRIREVFRRHPKRGDLGCDVIVIAKEKAGAMPMKVVQHEMATALEPPVRSRPQ